MSVSKIDLARDCVDFIYRTFLHNETEKELMSHANNIVAHLDETTNWHSIRQEMEGMVVSPEFKGKWMLKADCKPTCPPVISKEEIDKKIADAVLVAIKPLQEKVDAGIAYYSAGELIAMGIKKWLGLK